MYCLFINILIESMQKRNMCVEQLNIALQHSIISDSFYSCMCNVQQVSDLNSRIIKI